jgi:hypothetical protein
MNRRNIYRINRMMGDSIIVALWYTIRYKCWDISKCWEDYND